MGRPTSLNEYIISKTLEYENSWNTLFPEDKLPTIEGLALHINIARSTIYEWVSQDDTEDKKSFSDIVSRILAKQGKTLVNKGLSNEFNASITKVILTKHDYREGIENTGKGGKDLIPDTLSKEEKEKLLAILKKQ